jgi:hypothetical protein
MEFERDDCGKVIVSPLTGFRVATPSQEGAHLRLVYAVRPGSPETAWFQLALTPPECRALAIRLLAAADACGRSPPE